MSRLDADDWVEAGLRALGRGGLPAIAVEPLATELGASKGSFYWHFEKRDDLVVAVVDRWEQGTGRLIEAVQRGSGDAGDRLRLLFDHVFTDHPATAADRSLLAAAADPRVRSALDRVTRQRLGYLTTLMKELGFSGVVARRRAAFAYSAFLGQLQLRAATPEALEQATGSMRGYADEIMALMTAPADT